MRAWVNAAIWLAVYIACVSFVAWDSSPGEWNPADRFAAGLMGLSIAWSVYYLTPTKKP